MIGNLSAIYTALSAKYDFAAAFSGARHQQMALANAPLSQPLATTVELDKALALEAAHSQVMFAASQAMQVEAQQRLKAELEQQKRLSTY